MTHLPRLIIAAPMSGSGKTTITAGIISALTARGHQVAPFKCGPDYIDPTYHTLAAGRPCTNLDAWLTPPQYISTIVAKRSIDADIAIIEGVMGLFDGRSGDGDNGSTAHIARLTGAPVVLVLDVRGMARTAAAIVAGLRNFDPQVNVAGVIINRAASVRHAQMVTEAIESVVGIPVFGHLLRDNTLSLPERHLGLVPTTEAGEWQQWLDRLQSLIESTIDIDRLYGLASTAPPMPASIELFVSTIPSPDPRPIIAVARDEAFSFLYEDNLDLLCAAGAEVAFFSPLHDRELPPATNAIYLCGGFPELYAEQLSNNVQMLTALRNAAMTGIPIYAECGGLMYLTEGIVNGKGEFFALADLLPGRAVMTARLSLGYRQVEALDDSWLWRAGETINGHEFHYSTWEHPTTGSSWLYEVKPDAYRLQPQQEGVRAGAILASYIHLHFLAMPLLSTRFVEAARAAAIFGLPITPQP